MHISTLDIAVNSVVYLVVRCGNLPHC